MKRLGLWITFYAATMMAASWFSFHIGFQEGYDFATGLTTRTAAVKVICHGDAACKELCSGMPEDCGYQTGENGTTVWHIAGATFTLGPIH